MSDDRKPPVSRRDFLVRATQFGALSVLGSSLTQRLAALPVHYPPHGMPNGENGGGFAAPESLYSGLRWRLLGPFRGGRCPTATGVPGRPNEFYFGASNSGVWKTIDGGREWKPVFDSQPVASIGAVAVAASSPDVVYVGTGENTLRDSAGTGNGVYRSTDAGKTWTHVGLDGTHHIGKIAVHPHNPNVAFVAAIGQLYAASPDRGVFRTRDGGRSWQKVLFRNNDVGAVDVVIDPSNPEVVYAGLWNTRRPPWYTYAPTNGPGGGIWKSTDGGSTWKQLTNGLPKDGIGRTGIAVSASNPKRVYAVIDDLLPDPDAPKNAEPLPPTRPGGPPGVPQLGGFFRSDDGGASWKRLSSDPMLWGRGWYFEKLAVDPKNADVVYVSNVVVSRTMDGGKTWVALRGSPGGDDYHQPWVSPDDTNTVIVASDQGTVISRNAKAPDPRDVTWTSWLNQPTAQIYHVSVDYRNPYWVTGAQQDSGAVAVRSRGKFAEITMRDWEPIGAGGESGYTAGDQLNPGIIFGGTGQRYDLANNKPIRDTTQPRVPEGQTARGDWTQPLVFSKADPHSLYYSNQYLFKTTDGARTWTRISDDLTRPDPGVPANLDATAAEHVDRNGKRGVIYTIGPSPLVAPLLWVGTDDGLIHLSADDGKTWSNVTPSALTPWSRVTMIDASHFDADTAYASVDRHQLQDYDPYIYRTRDRGRTWQRITSGIPAGMYVHTVKEDPKRSGLLVAGTERGAFVSFDAGDSWQPLQQNLPVTSVRDFEFHGDDLVVATFGRGFWVIDDISPLRQFEPSLASAEAHLFKPADITYVPPGGDNGTPTQRDEPQAPNPPNGAVIYYYLGLGGARDAKLDVVDASGNVVHSWPEPPNDVAGFGRGRPGGIPNVSPLWNAPPEPFATGAGSHRVVWTPVPPRARRGGGGGGGVFAAPPLPLTGTFTARLTAGGKTYTQTFTVKADESATAG